MRALVVGYHAWDVLLPLAEWPGPDAKYEAPGLQACGGGPAATAAVALCRLGDTVRFAAVLADDAAGRAQRDELTDAGVDLGPCRIDPSAREPLAVSVIDPATAQRRIFWSRRGLPRLSAAEADPSWLDGCDLLYLDGHEPAAGAVLAAAARRRGLPVVLDAGTLRPGVDALLADCSDVICTPQFLRAAVGTDDPAAGLPRLLALGPARVGVTLGADGCVGWREGGLLRIPAFPVAAVDTTGAGDAFHAGYAHALGAGAGFPAALRTGCAVAALACTAPGGRAGLPDRRALTALLAGADR